MLKLCKDSKVAMALKFHAWIMLGNIQSWEDVLTIQVGSKMFSVYPKIGQESQLLVHVYSIDANGKYYHPIERDYFYKLEDWRTSTHANNHLHVRLLIDDFATNRKNRTIKASEQSSFFTDDEEDRRPYYLRD